MSDALVFIPPPPLNLPTCPAGIGVQNDLWGVRLQLKKLQKFTMVFLCPSGNLALHSAENDASIVADKATCYRSLEMDKDLENRRGWLLAVLLVPGLIPASGRCDPRQETSVQVIDGTLSIEAHDVRQDELLERISEKTGIRFHAEMPLEQKTSVFFQGLNAEAALSEILGSGANLFFRYPERTRQARAGLPEEVWVLGQETPGSGKSPTHESRAKEFEAEKNLQALQPEDVKALTAEAKTDLLEKLQSGNSDERVQAMTRLAEDGKAADEDVRKALETAITDGDPQVRMMAMQTLSSLPNGAEYIREALHDPDAGVRLMALASLSPGTENGHLVREALNDPDQTVRSQAQELIKTLGLSSPANQ